MVVRRGDLKFHEIYFLEIFNLYVQQKHCLLHLNVYSHT